MPILTVILVIIVVGVLLWLTEKYIPMNPTVKMILRAVVIIALVLWLLDIFGLLALLKGVKTPHA